MTDQVRQFTVDAEDDGIRLDRWFKRHLPDASFNAVSRWARTGQIRIDGKRATPGDRIEAGQQIRVPPADPVTVAKTAAKPKKERPRLSEDQEAWTWKVYDIDDFMSLDIPPIQWLVHGLIRDQAIVESGHEPWRCASVA
jgi:23S rRNA pseudouridine955/2504/2580 synthase